MDPSQMHYELLESELNHIYHTAQIPNRRHIKFRKRRFMCNRHILCDGKAEFYDCEFFCNAPQTGFCITISSSGELHFNGCTFKKAFSSGLFLRGNSGCHISFVNCSFVDCNTFAQLFDCAEIVFDRCNFQDCTSAVVEASFLQSSHFKFENSIWHVTTPTKPSVPAAFILSGENQLFTFKNCRYIQWAMMESSYSVISAPPNSICLLDSGFDHITFTISTLAVIGCIFGYCKNVLATNSATSRPYPSVIENCRFFHCSESIQAAADTEIQRCTFTACDGTQIRSASKLGHVYIADCTFSECAVNEHASACVELDRDCSLINGKINKIEDCTFKNCCAESGSLIGYQNEITPGYVAIIVGCFFNGCTVGTDGDLISQRVRTKNFVGQIYSHQIYTFCRKREKFILTDCHVEDSLILDNTPKTQYDTYDKSKCTARRGLLKEKIQKKVVKKTGFKLKWTFGVHAT